MRSQTEPPSGQIGLPFRNHLVNGSDGIRKLHARLRTRNSPVKTPWASGRRIGDFLEVVNSSMWGASRL